MKSFTCSSACVRRNNEILLNSNNNNTNIICIEHWTWNRPTKKILSFQSVNNETSTYRLSVQKREGNKKKKKKQQKQADAFILSNIAI